MPTFVYSACAEDGTTVSGEVQAENDAAALDQISRKGLTPITLTEGHFDGPWWNREINLFGQSGKVKSSDLERFFTTFSTLMQARFPLPRILEFCEKQTKNRSLKRALDNIRASVENGIPLGEAMQSAKGIFPARFVTLFEIGERSNRLPEVSANAAALLSSEAKMKRELRGALVYPAILLLMSGLVLALVVFYLAPTLMPVFIGAGATAPAVLRFMTGFREIILSGWPVIFPVLAAFLLVSYVFRTHFKAWMMSLLMHLPISGPYLKRRETLRLCQSLQLMLSGGASLPQSVSAIKEGAAFPAYRSLLGQAEERIIAGGTLSDTLHGSPLIDDMASALIKAGEESDRLSEILDTVVASLSASTAQTLNQMIRLLTPLLTLLIGLGVGGIILSTISAIMDLNDIAF
ncbi:MAG TPA: type II secretion system F family protein [Rhodobacteraceae bacterium]|nr:type II secretion system F family protein [Paracoccaceae bacterium]